MPTVHIHGMNAAQRRAMVLELLRRGPVATQQDLADRLAELGVSATQTTLSRDLAAIGAVKSPLGYALPGPTLAGAAAAPDTTDVVVSAEIGGTLLVLRTPPAHAHPVAQRIDAMRDPDVLGTIAGDDTVFVAARTVAAARRLAADLFPPAALQRGA
jgi:transcriptional regulator of arginine metabolism